MSRLWAAFVYLALAGPLCAEPPADAVRGEDPPDFFSALGLPPRPSPDLWGALDDHSRTSREERRAAELTRPIHLFGDRAESGIQPGWTIDPGRWRYQQETVGGLYRRKTKLELPDPQEVGTPYVGHDWKAQEKLHVPVPIPVPLAEQLFVYGQFDGSGDALKQQQTALSGKTGFGAKWSLIAGSEVQLRYATLFKYADVDGPSRAQPAVEVMARLPLVGPLELEYTGTAIPAVARTDTDQFKQELRFAYPLRGDNELEFGARYRWDYTQNTTPWQDRAELFLGLKLRH
ncbi:MAG TPA: hypothetical protein VKD90_01240 [Gemmataceae bacterium]|nr:hypothetical protein [Gemmataceae bacterium]